MLRECVPRQRLLRKQALIAAFCAIIVLGIIGASTRPAQASSSIKRPLIFMTVGDARAPLGHQTELIQVKAGSRYLFCAYPRPSLKVHWYIYRSGALGSQFAYVPGEPNCRRYVAPAVATREWVHAEVGDDDASADAYATVDTY